MLRTHGFEINCGYGVECGGVRGTDEWIALASLQSVTEIDIYALYSQLSWAEILTHPRRYCTEEMR